MAKIVVFEEKGNHVLPVTVTDAVRANDDSANLTELLDSLRSDISAIAKLIGEDADGNVFVRRKEDGTARALYSFGAISTKGNSNDSSGGGGGADLSAVWQSLTTNIDSFADLKINANHIPTLTSAKIGDFASAVAALVPTNISQLVNDTGFITASAIANKADKATTLAGYGITDALRKATENYSYDLNANKDLTQLYPNFQRMVVNGVDESPTGTSMRLGAIAIAGGGSASNLLFDHFSGGIWYRNYKNSWSNWKEIAFTDSTVGNALKIGNTALGDIYRISGWSSHLPYVYQNNIIYYYWYKIAQLDLSRATNAMCEIEVTTVNDVNVVGNASGTIVAKKYYANGMQFSMSIAYVANSRTRSKINVALDSSGGIWVQAYKSEWGSYLAFRTRFIDNAYNAVEVKYYSRQIEQPENSQVIEDNQHIRYHFGTATFSSIGILTSTLGALEVQTQNLVTNLNANYLQGLNKDAFVQVGADITAPNIHASTFLTANSATFANGDISINTDGLIMSPAFGINIGDYLTVNDGATEIHGDYFRIGAVSTIFTNSVNINGNVNLSSMVMTNNDNGVLILDGNYIDVHAPMNVLTTIKIGNATLSYDYASGMLLIDKGIASSGAISTKGVSNASAGIASAQFGLWYNDTWQIAQSSAIDIFGGSFTVSGGDTAVDGGTIVITSNAFSGKRPVDIEIFAIGAFESPTGSTGVVNMQLIPFKIADNKLYCRLYASGSLVNDTGFKIKVY